jgi:hypothetical protein
MFYNGYRSILALLPIALAVFLGCAPARGGSSATKSPPSQAGRVYDLAGHATDPFKNPEAKALVFVFVGAECPISNRYAPELNRLQARFAPLKIQFWLVYPDPAITPENAKKHMAEYSYQFGGLRDPDHALVKRSGATTTPEAAVFSMDGGLIYRGRINDRFPALGAARAAPTKNDLEDALHAFLDGKPAPSKFTTPVGCLIGALP